MADEGAREPQPGGAGRDPTEQALEGLMMQIQSQFETMSSTILGRIDQMSERINGLEDAIEGLMVQAGVDKDEVRRMAHASAADSSNVADSSNGADGGPSSDASRGPAAGQ